MRLRRRWSSCWKTYCWTATGGGEWPRRRRAWRGRERWSGLPKWFSVWPGTQLLRANRIGYGRSPPKTAFPTFLSDTQMNVPRGTVLFHRTSAQKERAGNESQPVEVEVYW